MKILLHSPLLSSPKFKLDGSQSESFRAIVLNMAPLDKEPTVDRSLAGGPRNKIIYTASAEKSNGVKSEGRIITA